MIRNRILSLLVCAALLACLLIVLRHWENIYRIRTGQENRISFKKKG